MLPERPAVTSPPRAVWQVSKIETPAGAAWLTVHQRPVIFATLGHVWVEYAQLNQWRLLAVGGVCGALVEVLCHEFRTAQDDDGMPQDAEVENVTWRN